MTRFIQQSACEGRRPHGVVPDRLRSRPRLLSRLLEDRGALRLVIFVQTTAAIETGINHNSVTVVIFTQNIRVNSTETSVAHGLLCKVASTVSKESPF